MWDRPLAAAVRRFAAAGLRGALLLAAQSIGAEPLAAQRRPDTTGAVAIRKTATVEPDCAPWDGAALAFWIPTERLGGPRNGWLSLRLWLPPTRAAWSVLVACQRGRHRVRARGVCGHRVLHA
ncbi:MAG: hypothetical protein ACK5U0_18365, partial [Gemmatimonas sp.]|uniref:hypothetical protein n=1 Tax=Gemmatimonas sp. TaxID=1962908 RepID=UPI00391B6764